MPAQAKINQATVGERSCFLSRNAFWLLHTNVRNSAAQIVEAASDPLLESNPQTIARARMALTNPRGRIACEIGWLPGVAPKRAAQLVEQLLNSRRGLAFDQGLPATARANVAVSGLELAPPAQSANAASQALLSVLQAIDAIDSATLLREINEDRSISSFAPIRSTETLDEALEEQRWQYRQVLRSYLDTLPSEMLIEALTEVVSSQTQQGRAHGGDALDGLVDAYDAEIQPFLEAEAASVGQLCAAMIENAAKGEGHLAPGLDRLIGLLSNWRKVARPVQLTLLSRGQVHQSSRALAVAVRQFTVRLVNEFDFVHAATQINAALLQHFTELPEFVETAQEDTETLVALTDAKAKHEASEAELSYSVHIGLSKELLSINGGEIVWQNRHFPTHEIECIRWGATRHSVNGIPTGTTHKIVFGTRTRGTEITTRNEKIYVEFTSRLWRIVGVRLVSEMLGRLATGEKIVVGGIQFNDVGVVLAKSKMFSKPEIEMYGWGDVKIYSDSGQFIIHSAKDVRVKAQASYQDHDNTHVLSNILHNAFRNGCVKLSAMLN